ncbi:MAG: hypothetical protein ACKPFK_34030, partial [Dolichospermum sp.]
MEQSLEKIASTQGDLEVAQKRLANAQTINHHLQKGSVYNFNRFNGDLPRLTIVIQITKQKIQNIQNQLTDYRRLQERLRQEIKVLKEQNEPKKLVALQQDYASLSTEIKNLDQRKKHILSGTKPIDQQKQFL